MSSTRNRSKQEDWSYSTMKMYEDFFVANIFRVWTSILLEQANPQLGEKVLDLACGTVSLFQ